MQAENEVILYLTLKKKWFDLTASQIKQEEYREIKDYWVKRLCSKHPGSVISGGDLTHKHTLDQYSIKKFTHSLIRLGYGLNAPCLKIETADITIGKPNPEWCDNWSADVFIIKHGKIVERYNC